MKTNATDFTAAAHKFFAAYDAHDVDGMVARCADGAKGRYAPYGPESVMPIRGGIDVIWRAFPRAVPNFRVKVIETIVGDGNSIVVQAEMSGLYPLKSRPLQRRVKTYTFLTATFCGSTRTAKLRALTPIGTTPF